MGEENRDKLGGYCDSPVRDCGDSEEGDTMKQLDSFETHLEGRINRTRCGR